MTAEIQTRSNDGTRVSALVVCDRRTGRERTLRRTKGRRGLGTTLEDVSVLRRRVAWIETRWRSRVPRVIVASTALGATRVALRVVGHRAPRYGRPGVVVVPGGLAWLVPTAEDRARLSLLRRGRVRLLGAGPVDLLGLDDGVTLRWRSDDAMRFRDLRPPPTLEGCPVRARFRSVLATPEVVVSAATYGPDEDWTTVLRACARPEARDPVIANDWSGGFGFGSRSKPVAASGRWVALVRTSFSRYLGCDRWRIRVVEAGTGRPSSSAADGACGPSDAAQEMPLPDRDAFAVTDAGVPVWLLRRPGDWPLRAARTASEPVELDRSGEGGITDLRSDGPRVTWRRDGQPRSAAPG